MAILGNYAVAIYAVAVAYLITRYRFLDIGVVMTRTAVFTGVYALLLGLPLVGALAWQEQLERLLGPSWWVWLWVSGVLLATAAHNTNIFLQRKAEARLLYEQRRYQAVLLQASRGMTQVRELKRLLNMIVHVITKTVGLSHAAIFLEDPRDETFALSALRHQRHVPVLERLRRSDPLIELLEETREPLVLDELKAQLGETIPANGAAWQRSQALSQMQALRASVVVPSFRQEELIGFLVLGDKRSGRIFTTEDLTVFSTLANQAEVAIDNARFYEEERQRQAALFHAATLASLGTMASSMGHQVNNRFNVVALVSSTQKMKLKELLSNGSTDVEWLRKALGECLEQFESLEEEAILGGQIVSSIRKLARPSTGEHKPLALLSAIKAGMDVVKHKVPFDDLDVHLDVPEDLPAVLGDLSQLGECFLNLVDNAYDAIKTREELIKDGTLRAPNGARPFRGSIGIRAFVKDPRTIQVEISDNGIGIYPENLQKLFIPFYTTKATTEKGTGLGLYVIKRIVEAHGGTIHVQSRHGELTTFTMTLPVAGAMACAA